jgi:hypothetical protein
MPNPDVNMIAGFGNEWEHSGACEGIPYWCVVGTRKAAA